MLTLRFLLWNLAWVLVLLLVSEYSLRLLMNHPPRGSRLLEPMREYYVAADRKILQFLPDCARWDETLGYTLRPGECRFSNREFAVEVHINSTGLRDDESSLRSPEIVVVGDSHAMGWGVEDNETFAQIVEERSGRSVLNAAISSYGTVRELMILDRLDTSELRWLIIQYCPNDADEIATYFKKNGTLKTLSEADYVDAVAMHAKSTRYYLGKHTQLFLPILLKSLFESRRWGVGGDSLTGHPVEEARMFLKLLKGDWNLPESVRLIVFEVNKLALNDSVFVEALRDEILAEDYPPFIEEMTIIDFSENLAHSDYLVYDGHMSADGHRVIADGICEVLGRADVGNKMTGGQ